jgi:hypothetical protein
VQTAAQLFGRSQELGVVDDLLERVGEQGAALLVRGEPGIGKSALDPSTCDVLAFVARRLESDPKELEQPRDGERIHLSHRTVGAHLYRVFPKLGVTSRAQLAEALSAQRDGTWPP